MVLPPRQVEPCRGDFGFFLQPSFCFLTPITAYSSLCLQGLICLRLSFFFLSQPGSRALILKTTTNKNPQKHPKKACQHQQEAAGASARMWGGEGCPGSTCGRAQPRSPAPRPCAVLQRGRADPPPRARSGAVPPAGSLRGRESCLPPCRPRGQAIPKPLSEAWGSKQRERGFFFLFVWGGGVGGSFFFFPWEGA